jgi:hypothetical protein
MSRERRYIDREGGSSRLFHRSFDERKRDHDNYRYRSRDRRPRKRNRDEREYEDRSYRSDNRKSGSRRRKRSSSSSTRSSDIDDSAGHYAGGLGDVIRGRCKPNIGSYSWMVSLSIIKPLGRYLTEGVRHRNLWQGLPLSRFETQRSYRLEDCPQY